MCGKKLFNLQIPGAFLRRRGKPAPPQKPGFAGLRYRSGPRFAVARFAPPPIPCAPTGSGNPAGIAITPPHDKGQQCANRATSPLHTKAGQRARRAASPPRTGRQTTKRAANPLRGNLLPGVRILLLGAALLSMAVFPLAAGGNAEDRPLRYALMGNPDSLDPHKTSGTLTFQVLKSVYDTLVEPDETGKIIPALAESWTISANGKIWTFRLRQGVSFHNGEPFTSRDVAATIRRIQAPATASPKSVEYAAITEIRALDDFTVQFLLSAPSAPLLASLASGWSAILPAPLIEAGHDFASRPVGTGPFVFEEWLRDNKISLKKNPSYWLKGKPKISALEFRVIPERAVQVQGLLTGQIDAAEIFDAADVALLEKAPGVQIKKNLTSMVAVLAMNTSREPLSNLKVRQAVNQAIDKQKVLDIAYGGGVPVGTFMDSGDPYYKDFTGLYPYNPDAARKLLAEAGPGQERELEMVVPQNYEYHVRAAQIYQEFLGKIGLSVKIRLVDWSTWMSLYSGKMNFDFTVIAHTGKLDPDSRLWGYGQETTYIRWVNPQAAALIAEGRTLFAFSRRKAVYDQVLEIMAREVPCVYTGTPYRYSGMAKNVEGCAILPKLDTPDFRDAEFK